MWGVGSALRGKAAAAQLPPERTDQLQEGGGRIGRTAPEDAGPRVAADAVERQLECPPDYALTRGLGAGAPFRRDIPEKNKGDVEVVRVGFSGVPPDQVALDLR